MVVRVEVVLLCNWSQAADANAILQVRERGKGGGNATCAIM